ncbi:MAG: hypothetical protein HRU70_04340 [Phycisphaeraceae bacterium]|nr:MAG: hypothetical protein HRU70_04340 [Phycisphaeraceae bacterium]
MAKRPARQPSLKAPKVVDVPLPDDAPPPPPAPISLASVLGQRRACATLRAAMGSQRLHHAWLFHGPRGVGKFTAALAFAAVLLDPTSEPDLAGELAPDPESPTQRLLRAGTHPDLHVVTKELARYHPDPEVRKLKLSRIPVDVVRHFLIEPATRGPRAPVHGRASKVFIVDDAELLDPKAGQNALLKTLEEPEGSTVIILVTPSPDRLIPTIRSRCQQVGFSPLTPRDMNAWLETLPPDELPERSPWLIDFADGSPGALLHAARAGMQEWHDAIAPGLRRALKGEYPAGLAGVMVGFIDAAVKAAQAEEGDSIGKEAPTREAAARMFRVIAHALRAALRERPGEADHPALDAIDALDRAERMVMGNTAFPFVAEWFVARLVSREPARF